VASIANTEQRGAAVDPRIERTRRVVRQAALDELGEAGYGSFTIESVAARAGVGKSTIYRHWPDKVALIADAFEASHETMVPDTQSGTARERIERLMRHVAEVAVDSTFSRCIPALIEGAARDPRLQEFHHRYSAERRHSLATVIEEGIAGGEFAADTDVDLAVTALLGAIFYGRLMAAESFQPGRASYLVDALLRQPAAEQQTAANSQSHQAVPIGAVESPLTELAQAPSQGDEGAPPAWLVFEPAVDEAMRDLRVGQQIIVLTWLDHARRNELRTHPRGDPDSPLLGVFSTRSPNRPNPIGLHRVQILAIAGLRILVSDLEVLDGTPILDVKPVLDPTAER
jgi:TetR/AcrR family transcriptional regulator, regulator of autoinduction and epiphytic fitness